MEYIIKVINYLEIRAISLKGTTKKFINQKEGFLGNAFSPLMKFGLPVMKNVLTPLANFFFNVIRINN